MRLAAAAPAVVLLALTSVAAAEREDDIFWVDPPAPRDDARADRAPTKLFLNRCVGGCAVRKGDDNDAATDVSTIPAQDSTLTEFGYTNEIWDAVVACVRDTYRAYDLEVVTAEPPSSERYVEVMVAGTPGELGQTPDTLGVAPMARDCSVQSNWVAFAFANAHGTDPVLELCATIAHEAGHVVGLEHVYECKDPMTYLPACGRRWFLNQRAGCGAREPGSCRCDRDSQNSHVLLTHALGPGDLPPAPAVTIPYPADDAAVIPNFAIFGEIVEPRVIRRVEFWLNDFLWQRQLGRREANIYTFATPVTVPDGVIDVEVRAYNDLELAGAATISVVKGAPCADASSCHDGQACVEGRCKYPLPTTEQGEACSRDADCASFVCASHGEHALCSRFCIVGIDGACGDGYACIEHGEDDGVCWPSSLLDTGGCCSASGGPAGPAALGGVLVVVLGRGRRRPRRGAS
jgi:hypothetical protein